MALYQRKQDAAAAAPVVHTLDSELKTLTKMLSIPATVEQIRATPLRALAGVKAKVAKHLERLPSGHLVATAALLDAKDATPEALVRCNADGLAGSQSLLRGTPL